MSNDKIADYNIHNRDMVTGLYGNQTFRNRLMQICSQKQHWEIMIFGIDNFKHINDLYSYSFGDMVLMRFAKRLEATLNQDVELFRLDGDGFGMLCPKKEGYCLLEQYKRALAIAGETENINGLTVSFGISGGICQYPEHGDESDVLYRNARIALARAKTGNKRQCVLYSEEMSVQVQRDLLLLDKLQYSVEHGFEGFSLNFQPIVHCTTKEIFGCEALLRWENSAFATGISPYVFIPILENSGLILPVGAWVLRTALKVCAKWLKLMPNFRMNINVSARQFEDPGFIKMVMRELEELQINPKAIILELTESWRVNSEKVRDSFDYLRAQGLKTAFDDFGTGYASLDIFRNISGDELKIDRSFLERITYDVTDQILLKSIVDMCRKMNIMVCVEGIETPEIEHIVTMIGPQLLQGYLYNRPMSEADFERQYLSGSIMELDTGEVLSAMSYGELRPAKAMDTAEIVDNVYAGIFQVAMDKDFSFLSCNEGYRRMLGYTAREIDEKFGNKALGVVYSEDVEWVNEEIRRQLRAGDTVTIEFRIVRSDGRDIWILGSGNVVRTPDGNSSLVVNIINNDEAKRESLRQAAKCAMYETILSKLPTGIKYIQYNPDFTINYISPGFLSILGYTEQEIFENFEGKYINLIHEEDRQKVFNDALDQVQKSDVVTLRYRSICKDGSIIWLETVSRLCPPEADGIQHCCSSVVNVTETITDEEKSHSLNVANRFQIAAQRWGDVIFEYNYKTGKAIFSESFESVLGYSVGDNGGANLDLILDEDKDLFFSTINAARDGEDPDPIEVRMQKGDGTLVWCRVRVQSSVKMGTEAVSAIGRITDISNEIMERESQRNEMQKDTITGLLNKGALELMIQESILANKNSSYAMFLLDIDDFKVVNDTYGHFTGDMVLSTMAKRLRNTFRQKDIIGRSGGDEYIVFMEYNGDRSVVEERGRKLLHSLTAPIKKKGIAPFSLSFSIGVACFPKDGGNFADLFQKADSVLYRVKREGKNCCHLA